MKKSLAGKACIQALLAGLALALLAAPGAKSAPVNANKDQVNRQAEERLRRDVTFLASDECEGRGPTTAGLNKAAEYIAREFKKANLKPGFKGGYFQPFAIAGAAGKLTLTDPAGHHIKLEQGKQFNPLGSGLSGKASGGVVFAGYGITCKEPPYDDYAGLDVKGKVVIVLRGTPRAKKALDSKEMKSQAPFVAKINAAKKNGAVALVLVNDADTAKPRDMPIDLSYSRLFRRPKESIPAVTMLRSVFKTMLPAGKTLADVEKGIDDGLKPSSFEIPQWKVEMELARKADQIPLKNVVGVLEGAGPLAKETIVVGAHYDHLGYGSMSSMSKSLKPAIHHGADDNGSGTTALMELARRFASIPGRQGRRLVFIAFSGEEIALLGSAHYCKAPIYPLKETAAMFNLDMVGRLRTDPKTGKPRILTEGHGTAKPFKELIDNLAKKYDFTLSSQASGWGPSDHASFCDKKVPVLFFWTGTHPDYHRPTDTADRINVPGMLRIVEMIAEVIASLTKMEKPAYVEVKRRPMNRYSNIPKLGISPVYGDDREGVAVSGVSEGGPADKGGIKGGDLIVGIAGKTVKDITDYMQALGTQKIGATIEVIVMRGGKKVPVKVKLE